MTRCRRPFQQSLRLHRSARVRSGTAGTPANAPSPPRAPLRGLGSMQTRVASNDPQPAGIERRVRARMHLPATATSSSPWTPVTVAMIRAPAAKVKRTRKIDLAIARARQRASIRSRALHAVLTRDGDYFVPLTNRSCVPGGTR